MRLAPRPQINFCEMSDMIDGFKLLGVHITSDLRWNEHTDKICAKASTRLYFLKQLKRAGLVADQLLCILPNKLTSAVSVMNELNDSCVFLVLCTC